jgi:hypothetical protein
VRARGEGQRDGGNEDGVNQIFHTIFILGRKDTIFNG